MYCVQYFSERRARLIIFQPFLHFFCRKICTVAYTSFSHIKIHSIVAQIQGIDLYIYLIFWLHIEIYLSILASYSYCCGSRIFSIPFIVVLSRCTVLAFCENCNNPRLVKNHCLLVVIRHLEYYLGREFLHDCIFHLLCPDII